MMSGDFVVDNSIVMAWCFEDESTKYTDAVQEMLINHRAFVPSIWPLEVANVLLVAERQNRISMADSGRFITLLSQLPIKVGQSEPDRVFHDTLNLARQHRLSSYDASYLALAIRMGLPIASLDKAILRAAKSIKIGIVK
jgi:predicted nucleic acid-binding protein